MYCLNGLLVPDIVRKMSVCSQTCQISEKRDLQSFYRETHGRNWLKQKYWNNDSVPHCLWEGVLCDNRTDHVIAIDLSGNDGMKGYVNVTLGSLKYLLGVCLRSNQIRDKVEALLATFRSYLIRFDVSYNKVFGSFPQAIATKKPLLGKLQLAGNSGVGGRLPSDIGNLKNLQVFSLGGTKVSGSIPGSIGQLKELRYLDFRGLKLKGSLTLLKNLTKLTYVNLMCNQISDEIPSNFGKWFPGLSQLSLQNNFLHGKIPSSVGMLSKLQILHLGGNKKLSGELPKSFRFLTSLKVIDISSTNLAGIPNGFYFNSTNLASFIAENMPNFACSIESLIDSLNFHACENSLMRLSVQNSGIYGKFVDSKSHEGNIVKGFSRFTRLTILNLARNRGIIGTIPDSIGSLSYLVSLDMSYTNLSGPLPSSYLNKLEMLLEIDVRGNPLMKGDIDLNYLTTDMSTFVKVSDKFSCPIIRFVQNRALVRIDSSYYDQRLCQCNDGYYGFGGHCKNCLKPGGQCYRPLGNGTYILSSEILYFPSLLDVEEGYWPFPNPKNTKRLLKCQTSKLGKKICNPGGRVRCLLQLANRTSLYKTDCSGNHVCLKGHYGRLCSICQDGYYKYGIACRPCATGRLKTKEIIGIVVTVVMLVILVLFIYRFAGRRAALVISLVIIEVIVVLLLASFGIVPSWLAEFNILIILLGLGGFAKTSKGFLKIGVVYIQVTDALISTSNIWPEAVYKAQMFISNAFNLQFSSVACKLPMLFTPLGKLVLLSLLPIAIIIITWSVYAIWYLFIGRRNNVSAKTRKYQCGKFCITFLNLLYFPLVKMVFSVFSQCRQISNVSFMRNYVWIDCGSKQHITLLTIAIIATPIYVFPGLPCIFGFLLLKNRNRIKRNEPDVEKWLGPLYTPYKKKYCLYMEVVLAFRRLGIASMLATLSEDLNKQTFFITTMFVLSIAFETHTKPFKIFEHDHGYENNSSWSKFWRKVNEIGLENIAEISSLGVMLISFVVVRFEAASDGTGWNTSLLWVIVVLNILIILFLLGGIIIRIVTREQGTENENSEIAVDEGQQVNRNNKYEDTVSGERTHLLEEADERRYAPQ